MIKRYDFWLPFVIYAALITSIAVWFSISLHNVNNSQIAQSQSTYTTCLSTRKFYIDTNTHVREPLKAALEYLAQISKTDHQKAFKVYASEIQPLPLLKCVKS